MTPAEPSDPATRTLRLNFVEPAIGIELAREPPDGSRLSFPNGGHNIQKTHGIELGSALSEWPRSATL